MRETRTALARTFVLLAMMVLPDGMGRVYVDLFRINEQLKDERRRQMEGV